MDAKNTRIKKRKKKKSKTQKRTYNQKGRGTFAKIRQYKTEM